MPDWFINAVATGGPAAAIIMTYMWSRAEKRAEKYENLWVDVNKVLPQKIMDFTEEHRKTQEKLVTAVSAIIKKGGGKLPRLSGTTDPPEDFG